MATPKLSKLEFQIMETLWGRGEPSGGDMSIREILDALPAKRRPAYTTIQTTIYRMEAKGILRRVKKVGNFHLFSAAISRDAAQRRMIDELLALLGGRPQAVIAHLVETVKLTLDDVKDAEKLLREHSGKQEPSGQDNKGTREKGLSAMIPNEFSAALVNHLWQSTAIVGIAWMLAWALRKNRARARYWVWMTASVKFLVPFSLLMMAGARIRSWVPVPATQAAVTSVMAQATAPFTITEFSAKESPAPTAHQAVRQAAHHANWGWLLLLIVWLSGALIVLGRFARGWVRVHAAKRGARPAGVTCNREWFGLKEKATADPSLRLPRIRKTNAGLSQMPALRSG